MATKADCKHQYGDCMTAICAASDSKLETKKCWCPECKELRKEIKARIKEFNSKQWGI